uniref:Uncharacterized protein n=1 Tax=Populus trichocarpa TaxID=3694 RepID=A9PGX4_POPTR|nr:unknown [Populus trichocarpa]
MIKANLSVSEGDQRTRKISKNLLLVTGNNFPVISWLAMMGLIIKLG